MTTPKDFKAEQASVPVNVDELRKSKDLVCLLTVSFLFFCFFPFYVELFLRVLL